ncbi:MAG: IS91 family transposase, partial [Rhodanobacteraceae bacterium]
MAHSGPEVADVFRRYGDAYRSHHAGSLSTAQRRVMSAIELCRSAALGGHVEQCDHCGHRRIAYNSCRNRHCPRCQSLARAQWLDARRAELLDTPYFHVVFTLPGPLAAIAYQNKACVYGLLFRATAETLRTIAADPKHLGAEIGFFAVLHTWGQNLLHHPHLHCVVPGGGLAIGGDRWVGCKPGFFLPVRVLSRLFRRLFLEHLEQAFTAGRLQFFGDLAPLREHRAFRHYLIPLRQTEWVVYAKAPFAGPEQVLDYVGRYTHRVALSNHRILDIADGMVRFRWKDYRHGNRRKVMTVSADEFMRRFLLHVLPAGFHRIRYYG